jgi:hypothetical protein
MTAGMTSKPTSPRRSRSPPTNPNRLIAPNTPAEGIARPMGDSTARSQTPDAPDVNALPTKGPLGVRKNTIAAKKRTTELAMARETARTQAARSSLNTVQRARRSTTPNIPQPGANTQANSPEPSIPSQQMPNDDEETATESDAAIRRRRRRSQSNLSEHNPDEKPSQPKRPGARSLTDRAIAQELYRKVCDSFPDKSLIVSRRDLPKDLPPIVGSLSRWQKYIKMRNEAEGVQS